MQLRYLKEVVLKKITKVQRENGTYQNVYDEVKKYKVLVQPLTDEISASVYGADVNKMYRLINKDLQEFLQSKQTNEDDNLSTYAIDYNGLYTIKSVVQGIDIERY